ncbi:MAG: hypothetical protein ACRELV_06895, partial [Longimicrobiales bacterium]
GAGRRHAGSRRPRASGRDRGWWGQVMRTTRRAVLALGAVLFVGVLAGIALEEVVDDWDWIERLEGEDDADDLDEAILDDLDLTPAQATQIDVILEAREDRIEEYWRRRLPEIGAIVDSTRAQIRAVLTPDQRREYDRRVQESADSRREGASDSVPQDGAEP